MGNLWNSTFSRPKTPWQRKQKEPLKKTPLKKVSRARAKENQRYFKVRDEFLRENPECEICIARRIGPNPSTEVHHKFGRAHSLLCDVRGFIASCFTCRSYPHEHPSKAREIGVLGRAVDWNRPIDRHGEEPRKRVIEAE